MDSDLKLFLSVFLWKALPAVLALISLYFVDPIWFKVVKPTAQRVADRFWDRMYVAYWRRKGFGVSDPARRVPPSR